MGTRNLTCVVLDGEYKVAQYGQWDGYPEGNGRTILEFLLQEGGQEQLKLALQRCRFMDIKGNPADKALVDDYNERAPKFMGDSGNRTSEQVKWFSRYISRDIGGEILENISTSQDEEILLRNSLDFAGDSLSCEWAYVIDFDKGTFEVYKGFNTEPVPLEERFACCDVDDYEFKNADGSKYRYYQVRFLKEFRLNDLPSVEEFLGSFLEEDEE